MGLGNEFEIIWHQENALNVSWHCNFGDEPNLFYISCDVFTYSLYLWRPLFFLVKMCFGSEILVLFICWWLSRTPNLGKGVVNLHCCGCNVPMLSHIPLLELFSSTIKLLKNFISLIITFSPCLFSLSDRLLLALVLHPYPPWGL